MIRPLVTAVVAIAAMFAASDAQAILITANGSNTGVGTAVNLLGANPVVVDNVGRTITIDLEVLALHTPFSIGFDASSPGPVIPAVVDLAFYRVTLNMTNSMVLQNAGLINGFDVSVADSANNPFMSLVTTAPHTPSSTVFGVMQPNIPTGFRFGGVSGGGPTISFGQTASSQFTVQGAAFLAGSKSFSLNFVANPEPTTMLLGSLVAVPAGAIYRRRRANRLAATPAV